MLNFQGIDLTRIKRRADFIERCKVISLGSGSAPKDITIQLPDGDGAQVPARWSGFPSLAVNDYVVVRRTDMDTIGYVVAGVSSSSSITMVDPNEVREKLTANRQYYVNASTGSDSNDGLSSGAAWATPQKACDVIGGLDLDIYNVNVAVADGAYSPFRTKGYVGAGTVTFTGDKDTLDPGWPKVTITATGSNNCIEAFHTAGNFIIEGFKLSGSSGISLFVLGGSGNKTHFLYIDFGANGFHILASEVAQVINDGIYSITGGATAHMLIQNGAQYVQGAAATCTLTGTPAFSSRFAWARDVGIITASGITYSGSATGQRYYSDVNADINTGGGGATFFPGNAAGATANGGQYV